MAMCKYNNVQLPELPSYDITTYPYAWIIYNSVQGIYALFCTTLQPVVLNEQISYPIGASYLAYITTSSLTEWSVVEMDEGDSSGKTHITPLIDTYGEALFHKYIWSNTEIRDVYSGVLVYEGSEPIHESSYTYLYNGIQLPILPEWNREKFPYAYITADSSDFTTADFGFYATNVPCDIYGGYFSADEDNNNFIYTYCSLKYNGVIKATPVITTDYYTGRITTQLTIYKNELLWSNYNMKNGIASSRPTHPITGEEITLYDLSAKTTPTYNAKSLFVGMRVGREMRAIAPMILQQEQDVNEPIEHNGIIPEGGTYYVGVTSTKIGDYTGATATYSAGDDFPETVTADDVYVFGDYEYRYNRYLNSSLYGYFTPTWAYSTKRNAWSVSVLDRTKESYNDIISVINGKDVVDLRFAFWKCTELKTAPNIPYNAENMGYTFYNCSNLVDASNLILSKSLINFDDAFYSCTSLVYPPDISKCIKLKSLDSTFYKCETLKVAPVLPPSISSMTSTFSNCISLEEAPKLPTSVNNLANTFTRCTSLKVAPAIPPEVKSMRDTFSYCSSLKVAPDFSKAKKLSTMYMTFWQCTSLEEMINLPPNIVYMYDAFAYCGLKKIPDMSMYTKLTSLYCAFEDCGSLIEIHSFPPNVEDMRSAFSDCSSLATIPEIPNKVKNLGSAFARTAITSVPKIPSSALNIESMFSGCSSLIDISGLNIPSGVTSTSYLFNDCTSLVDISVLNIPRNVTSLSNMFNGCTAITDISMFSIPDWVTDINGLFQDCTGLIDISNIVIKDGVTSTSYMFRGCTGITDISHITIPKSVVNQSYMFRDCTGITSVTGLVIDSIYLNMFHTFYGCTNLTGTIQINGAAFAKADNNSYYNACFEGTTKAITLKGNGSNGNVLTTLKGTANNRNVTIS